MRQRLRTAKDIVVRHRYDPEWLAGVLLAANMADDYAASSSHPYLIGDCILGKLNLLPKRRVRKNLRAQR